MRILPLLLALFVVLAPSNAQTPHATDRAAISDLLQASMNWPSSWNAADLDNLCSWAGISCNSEGRITVFSYSPVKPTEIAIVRGYIPDSFWALPSLERINLPRYTLLSGTVPASLFQKENITFVQVWNSAQIVVLPQTLSASLTELRVGGVTVSGKIWDSWSTSNLVGLEMDDDNFECPLPQWLVDKIINNQLSFCQLTGSRLTITNNKLCNQIDASQLNCWVLPQVEVKPRAATATHHFGNRFVEVELSDRFMYIYGARILSNGTRFVYRDEYVAVDFQGWQQRNFDDASNTMLAQGWGATLREDIAGKEYSSDLIMGNGMTMQMYFKLEHPLAPEGVKFGFKMTNDPAKFNYSMGDPAHNLMSFGTNFFVRQQMWDKQPLFCNGTSVNPFSGQEAKCTSDVGSLVTVIGGFFDGFTVVSNVLKSPRLQVSLGLVGGYYKDGQSATFAESDLGSVISGIGSGRHFGRRYMVDPANTPFPNVAPADQWLSLPFSAGFEKFGRVDWDPDVSITLLFDPEQSDPPAVREALRTATIGGAIGASAAVVAIILIVVLTDMKYKCLPFRGRTENAAASAPEPILEDEGSFAPKKPGSGWASGDTRRASLVNTDTD